MLPAGVTAGTPNETTVSITDDDLPAVISASVLGGGGATGPTPSVVDFEWTVKRDLEVLESGHDTPSGMWSNGATIWILENGAGADDAVYAYDLSSGERVEGREFVLAAENRAPRGMWSNDQTVWVSDSGRARLYAYGLEGGEREEGREFDLAERNRDARGIWSDGETMWVLDSRSDALFAYNLATGQLLGEYSLASRNGDPRGVWSDSVTIWVSDHGLRELWAYRLPTRPDAPVVEDAGPLALERVDEEDFTHLSGSSKQQSAGHLVGRRLHVRGRQERHARVFLQHPRRHRRASGVDGPERRRHRRIRSAHEGVSGHRGRRRDANHGRGQGCAVPRPASSSSPRTPTWRPRVTRWCSMASTRSPSP